MRCFIKGIPLNFANALSDPNRLDSPPASIPNTKGQTFHPLESY